MSSPTAAQLEALTALAAEASERGVELLRDRWSQLDHSDPIVMPSFQFSRDPSEQTVGECWVQSHQITGVDHAVRWGQVDNRPETFPSNMETLAACDTEEEFAEYLEDLSEIQLMAVPGPLGPLFTTGGDGRHRTHIVKALALPPLLIGRVIIPKVACHAGDRATVSMDFRRHRSSVPFTPRGEDPDAVHAEHLASARRLHHLQVGQSQATLDHLQALEANAVITDLTLNPRDWGQRIEATFTLNRDLPASRALELPAHVERFSRRYTRSYPQFAATPEGAAMCDQAAWIRMLSHPSTDSAQEALRRGDRQASR